jgi:2',3'-cyclic-nucleotide 2'-phosphodiesterase (5'-nucleotidase family)
VSDLSTSARFIFLIQDFDNGFDVAASQMSNCNFPWLLSNVLDHNGHSIKGTRVHHIVNHFSGLRIGFIGLAEKYAEMFYIE